MRSSSLRKKNKPVDTITAARVHSDVLKVLKSNNVNVSSTIREFLTKMASDLSKNTKKAV